MSTATLPILEAAVLVVAAPVCGVVLGTRRFRGVAATATLFGVALALSAGWTMAAHGWSAGSLRTALVSHVTLAAIGVALAAFGGWCLTACRDPLDAVAVATGASLVAALGPIAAGPLVADLPTGLVNAALTVSPIVSAASAADLDLFRSDLLYRISPLAHGRFDYPVWYSPLVLFGTLLLISVAATNRALRKRWL